MTDEELMQRALDLAKTAEGWTSPNPMVGALVVKNGKIVGEGFHKRAGTPHAEVHALAMAGEQAKGAAVYVTLEPCCHYGRTPPCTEALIKAGVAKVVVAVEDPNPKVAGGGIKQLREAGIQVVTGVLEKEARLLNEVFLKAVTAGRPFIVVKTAVTLDGKTASKTGSSKWITGEEARETAHKLRHKYDAILVGIGTILSDNPQLTTRIPGLKNPVRVIIDSTLRTPPDAHVLNTQVSPTLIYTCAGDDKKAEQLRRKGVEIIACPGDQGKVDLVKAFENLYQRGLTSVLVEGGAEINGTLFDGKLIDKIYLFVAPKLAGSSLAPGIIGGSGISDMKDAVLLSDITVEKVGEDFLFTGYPKY